jgi:mannose-1-phosphate guanylyltransferase
MAAGEPVAVIMAGGSGTRFWPLSKPSLPKQYLKLLGDRSLIQETVARIAPLVSGSRVFIASGLGQAGLLREQLPRTPLILEPQGRNTAACLILSVVELERGGVSPDTVMFVLPADHHIARGEEFLRLLRQAAELATSTRGLVTLGIVPTSPHTGYGYIEARAGGNGPREVARFVEKPTRARAEEFLRRGNFFWNSGMFIWTLGALREAFQRHMPEAWRRISSAHTADELSAAYAATESVPIDVGVLEKASNLYVIPADIGWSDIGSWDALHGLLAKEPGDQVVLSGDARGVESRGCLVSVPAGKKVALVGVEDLIVVESEGTLLIARRDQDQLVREASKKFEG